MSQNYAYMFFSRDSCLNKIKFLFSKGFALLFLVYLCLEGNGIYVETFTDNRLFLLVSHSVLFSVSHYFKKSLNIYFMKGYNIIYENVL